MENFEREFYEIAKSIEFRENTKYGKFQNELKKDVVDMMNSRQVIIAADKSENFYMCDVDTYRKPRSNNVESGYRKSFIKDVEKVNVKTLNRNILNTH